MTARDDANQPFTVTNTQERQELIARTTTHGKKFYTAGGDHIISNNLFQFFELGQNMKNGKE
jgi:hypothetical protein